MCVFWHPQITLWHHFTNKTASKNTWWRKWTQLLHRFHRKVSYRFGVCLLRFFLHWKVVAFALWLSGKKKQNMSWQEKVDLWLWPNDQIRECKRCICPAFDPNESLLFSEATGKRATFWHSCRGEGEAEVSSVPLQSFTAEEYAF